MVQYYKPKTTYKAWNLSSWQKYYFWMYSVLLKRLSPLQNDLLFLKVTSQLHHLSIKCAIHVLHINSFNPHCLRRRPVEEVKVCLSNFIIIYILYYYYNRVITLLLYSMNNNTSITAFRELPLKQKLCCIPVLEYNMSSLIIKTCSVHKWLSNLLVESYASFF